MLLVAGLSNGCQLCSRTDQATGFLSGRLLTNRRPDHYCLCLILIRQLPDHYCLCLILNRQLPDHNCLCLILYPAAA